MYSFLLEKSIQKSIWKNINTKGYIHICFCSFWKIYKVFINQYKIMEKSKQNSIFIKFKK
jgi:hypothetical protein